MNIPEEDGKREEFRKILFDLAKTDTSLKNPEIQESYYKRLEKLYYSSPSTKPFRHFYSDIFSVLTHIQQNAKLGSIDILGQNLGLIRNKYQAKNQDNSGNLIDISDCIRKLYDHVNLDIARITYSDSRSRTFVSEDSIKDIHAQIDRARTESDNLNQRIERIRKSQENYLTQVVSILSIFAAIVLAFSGGLNLFSNAFQVIRDNTDSIKMIFVFSLFGFIMYNIIVGLLFIIARMSRKDIGIYCKYSYGCQNCHRRPQNGIAKILCQALLKYPYITVIEIILILLVYILFLLWMFPFSENMLLGVILLISPIVILGISLHKIKISTKDNATIKK